MNIEEFRKLMVKVKTFWPDDKIIEDINKPDEQKLIVQCENGSYVLFKLMMLSNELLEDLPQMTVDLMHEKLLIQYTDDLDRSTYQNLGRYIANKEYPSDKIMKEAMKELAFRINIGDFFAR